MKKGSILTYWNTAVYFKTSNEHFLTTPAVFFFSFANTNLRGYVFDFKPS